MTITTSFVRMPVQLNWQSSCFVHKRLGVRVPLPALKLPIMYNPNNVMQSYKDQEWYGNYNTPPAGWREVTEKEFATQLHLLMGHMVGIESRQLIQNNTLLSAHLVFFSDRNGYAIVPVFHQERVRLFLFEACKHEWKHVKNLGRSYDEYKCTKCERTNTIDSGD